MTIPSQRFEALKDILIERAAQVRNWGDQKHPDGTGGRHMRAKRLAYQKAYEAASARGAVTWKTVLEEEVYEAMAETDKARLREELIQVAAVAVAWVEDIDRRG